EAGSGERIYDAPWTAYAARFFSQVNDIPARLENGSIETPLGRFPVPAGMEGVPRLFLRPQSIRLAESGISAQVLDRAVLGEIEELSLAVEGLVGPLMMRGTDRHDVRVGDVVHIKINNDHALIFP